MHREHTSVVRYKHQAMHKGCHKPLMSFCLVSIAESVLRDLDYLRLKEQTWERRKLPLFFVFDSLHIPLPSAVHRMKNV